MDVTLVSGDSLLVVNEAAGANNGIYVLTQVGSGILPYILTRRTDADSGAELVDAVVPVSEGTLYANTQWENTTPAPIVVGTTAIVWVQTSGSANPNGFAVLVDGATVTVNIAATDHFAWTPAAARHVLQAATGIPASGVRTIYLRVIQPVGGGITPQFAASYLFPRGVALVNLAPGAETLIVLEYQANDATWIQVNGTPTPAYSSTVTASAANISLAMHLQGPSATDDGPLNLVPTSSAAIFSSNPSPGILTPLPVYNLGYANFNGSGTGGIRFPANAAFNMGSGDFTVEAWVSISTAAGISGRLYLCGQCTSGGTNGTFVIQKTTAGALSGAVIIGGVTQSTTGSGSQFTIGFLVSRRSFVAWGAVSGPVLERHPAGRHAHLPLARLRQTRPIIFGVGQNGDLTLSVGGAYGSCWLGQIYDFFLWKGLGKYSANFTPPLGQLPDH